MDHAAVHNATDLDAWRAGLQSTPSWRRPSGDTLLNSLTPALKTEFTGNGLCYPMVNDDSNSASLSLGPKSTPSSVTFTTTSICFSGDDHQGDFIGEVTIKSGTTLFSGTENLPGWYRGTYGGPGGSLLFGHAPLTFTTYYLPGQSGGTSGGGPPSATPELDSALLLASGLFGSLTWLARRRR
jgi:hypothetical protein